MAQTTLRQLADGKVIQNTVTLFQTSSCTGYSATADLHSLSLNLLHPYTHYSTHVHEKRVQVLWREEGLEKDLRRLGWVDSFR